MNQARDAGAWRATLSACLGFPRPIDICPVGVMYQQLFLLLSAAWAGSQPELF